MQDFRNLRAWQKAHSLTLDVYPTSRKFPPEEIYGPASQVRPAASLIGADMAEGCYRKAMASSVGFCRLALESASEVEYHCALVRDLKFLQSAEYERLNHGIVEI